MSGRALWHLSLLERLHDAHPLWVWLRAKALLGRGGSAPVRALLEKGLARWPTEGLLRRELGNLLCRNGQVRWNRGKKKEGLDLMARGVSMKSNMHNALFKPATLEMWVANSTVEQPACNLPYSYYDLKALVADKPGS